MEIAFSSIFKKIQKSNISVISRDFHRRLIRCNTTPKQMNRHWTVQKSVTKAEIGKAASKPGFSRRFGFSCQRKAGLQNQKRPLKTAVVTFGRFWCGKFRRGPLLGLGTDNRTEVGRRIDVIGQIVDLDTQRVLFARKNFLSALHGFIPLNMEGKITLRTAQRLASWASRYEKICRVMRSFCRV